MERPFQAYEGDEPYVFVCYAHDDKALVYPELLRLRDAGFHLWYDEGISPGSEWSDALATHIEHAAVFLYFVTPRSVVSDHCRREVNFALEQPCGMLAVHLEPTELPSGLQLTLSNRQAILKHDEPTAVYEAKLAAAIHDAERRDVQETPTLSTLTLGEWTLDVASQRLSRGDESQALDPKALSVLLHLIDRAPDAVSRQGLIDRTWPDVVVGENVLDQAIAQLRRAVGDDARDPKYIETLPRRGYRLFAPIGPSTAPPEEAGHGEARGAEGEPQSTERAMRASRVPWRLVVVLLLVVGAGLALWRLVPVPEARRDGQSLQAVPDRSIAVMTLSVVGGDVATETYADALTEELRTVVAGYPELRAISVQDAVDGDDDEASYVLGGSLQPLGRRVRLRAHLTRADDRHTVWAETFEQPLADHVPDPAELATTVGRFVRLQLVQDQQCESVRRTARTLEAAVAYCAVLAEFFRSTQVGDFDLHLAMDRAQRAVALDPDIADAHFFVGWSYVWLAETGQLDWRDAARHARASLGRGLTLVPNDAQLLALRGRIESLEMDYQAADASFRASLAGDPLHPRAHLSHGRLGNLALAQGHISEALGHFERSLRIYDANAAQYSNYGIGLLFAGQNREALGAVDSGLRLVERGGTRLYLLAVRALAYDALGETAEANAALDEALATVGPGLKPALAFLLARLGRLDEARALLSQLEAMETPPVEFMVRAYVELDRDRAFEWIHIAIDRHVGRVFVGLRTSIVHVELRQDPRWAEVMAHLEAEEAKGRVGGRGSE